MEFTSEQLIFTLSYKNVIVISPFDSSRRKNIMSKYIPGNQKHFCIHRYYCKKTNACGKIILCEIKSTSCPICNQTCKDFVKERCSRLDKTPMSVTAVQRKSVTVRLHINTATTHILLTGNTAKNFEVPGPVLTWQNRNYTRRIKSFLL